MKLNALFQNRLLQFMIGGAILFWMAPQTEAPKITISKEEINAIFAAHASRKGYASVDLMPETEKSIVLRRLLQDEVLYREGTRLELEKHDHIVRQRLIQKVLFLAEELEGAAKPTSKEDLTVFFEKHKEQYRVPDSYAYTHVFSDDAKSLEALKSQVKAYDKRHPASIPPFGKAFPLTRAQSLNSVERIKEVMGEAFAKELAQLPIGEWSKPIRSKFGYHLVKLTQRVPSHIPALAEISHDVQFEYETSKKQESTVKYISRLFSKEPIYVEGYTQDQLKPTVESIQLPGDSGRVED